MQTEPPQGALVDVQIVPAPPTASLVVAAAHHAAADLVLFEGVPVDAAVGQSTDQREMVTTT
jgi:hypothetical protein